MKTIFALVVVCFLCAVSASDDLSVSDIAQVLGNEPAAASEARFAETRAAGDVVTFRDGAASSPSTTSTSTSSSTEASDEDPEIDGQIAQADEDIKKLKESIKESHECSHRLKEQQAELSSLNEQLDHLEKEKQKHILQTKLEKQMKDLSEINKMTRALRAKFNDLKRTQQLIKTKLTGTKSSLNQLENNPDLSLNDIKESGDNISSDVDSMHQAQSAVLESSQKVNSREVKTEIKRATNVNLDGRKKAAENSDSDDV